MIVFVIVGFSLCYLFKDRISGFANLAQFGEETDTLNGGSDNPNGGSDNPSEKVINEPQLPGVQMEKPVGIELRERKPEPSPSTKQALEVMAQKPPVEKKIINQSNGLLVQDSMIFKPFDEVWNPGFMPLDMVFKNVPGPMGQNRPMGQDRPMGQRPVMEQNNQPSPSGGSEVNLVLVYAPWCGHSKRMLPDFERVKSEFDGKTINGKTVNVIMYNSDVDKDKVKEYGVKGFPSLFLEKDGNREPFPHRSYDKISDYLNNL